MALASSFSFLLINFENKKKSAEIIQNAELLFKIIKVISFYFSPRIIAHNYQEAAAASTAAPTAAAPTAA